jgi:RHS repeat-associated protein
VDNPYRYAGYRYDKVTGLYYLQSRYYKPDTGRFLTKDTFEGFENEPLSLNKYAYAGNNPVNYVDPTGKAGIKNSYVSWTIDIALILWGYWQWDVSRKALNMFLKRNWQGISRLIRVRFVRKHYSAFNKFMATGLNIALTISGNSIGQIVAKVIDRYVDPRLGYKKNNGRCFG